MPLNFLSPSGSLSQYFKVKLLWKPRILTTGPWGNFPSSFSITVWRGSSGIEDGRSLQLGIVESPTMVPADTSEEVTLWKDCGFLGEIPSMKGSSRKQGGLWPMQYSNYVRFSSCALTLTCPVPPASPHHPNILAPFSPRTLATCSVEILHAATVIISCPNSVSLLSLPQERAWLRHGFYHIHQSSNRVLLCYCWEQILPKCTLVL